MKKLLIISLLFPFVALAISPSRVGTDTTTTVSASSATWTISHTVPTTGGNRCLIIAATGQDNSQNITGMTWNGTAMTNILHKEAQGRKDLDMYYIADPDTGTHNAVITWAGAMTNKVATIFTLQDCAQSSPTDGTNTNYSAGATSLSASVTSTVDGDLYLVWMVQDSGTSYVDNGTQTRVHTAAGWNGDDNWVFSLDPQVSFGAKSMGYSWTTSGALDLAVVTIKLDEYVAPVSTPQEDLILFE